jgi:hypothetical protein
MGSFVDPASPLTKETSGIATEAFGPSSDAKHFPKLYGTKIDKYGVEVAPLVGKTRKLAQNHYKSDVDHLGTTQSV